MKNKISKAVPAADGIYRHRVRGRVVGWLRKSEKRWWTCGKSNPETEPVTWNPTTPPKAQAEATFEWCEPPHSGIPKESKAELRQKAPLFGVE